MENYDIQQVCLNGHQITANYNSSPQFRKNFCDQCGEKTIYKCQKCLHPIKGDYYDDERYYPIYVPVPTNCEYCGSPFPWTIRKEKFANGARKKSQIDALDLVKQICTRFHLIAKQLRTRYNDRETLNIKDEYDTQDLLHSLLYIYFDDIRPEEWTPSYAGGSSRIDFILKNESIAIEVKKARKTLKAKKIGDELLVDIQRYKNHPDCNILVCFIYDPEGWLSNPRGLEKDLNLNMDYKNFKVVTIIVPRGY